MKQIQFTPHTKLANLILHNFKLLPVITRFGIPLGFGEKTVAEVCKQYAIPTDFFILVCNIYTHDEYAPSPAEIRKVDIHSLLAYLSSSHQYYLSERIVEIEASIQEMSKTCTNKYFSTIETFYDGYKKEIVKHLEFEETSVFPYIQGLLSGEKNDGFGIQQFENNHTNIEEKLGDLKNIIIKYVPIDCASKERNKLLYDIFLFEEDLNRHTLIEDKILIPYVEIIEKTQK
ncbi:MAG: hemerythrin domain-containing protein [Paludibacteraceae bacterium]|nr:hemerythrin domain-containing protein [Paludibacteraceae bacterium]MBP6283802.1 hemerythrin domain-containing protein [Paludibacteraceae bacterium]